MKPTPRTADRRLDRRGASAESALDPYRNRQTFRANFEKLVIVPNLWNRPGKPQIAAGQSMAHLRSASRPSARATLLAELFLLLVAATLAAATSPANPGAAPGATLRTITTAREAHDLSSNEAKRAYPVHLHGVVTYFDNDTGTGNSALYIRDSTGSIFLRMKAGTITSLPVGTVVDVHGVSGLGGFAPIVDHPQIQVLSHGKLPAEAPSVSRTLLFGGGFEGQWVEVEGVVHSVSESTHTVTIELAMVDGILFATTVREPGADYASLIDSKVRIHGNEAPLFNRVGQMIGARVVFPNLSTVQVIESRPADPFQLPAIAIDSLMRWDHVSALPHRVHIRGRVTMQWPGTSLCVRDAFRGLCAQTLQNTPVGIGDVVDVAGFAAAENSTTVLTNAVFRKAESGVPIAAVPVTAEEALLGNHNSELIRIDGSLIGRDLASSDTTLMLSSGKFIFSAVLPRSLTGPEVDGLKNGSKLQITGICSIQFDAQESVLRDGMAVPKYFRIMMRSPADVVVIQTPSWWTPGHMIALLALALAGALVVLGWVVVLRKRLEQQTILIRESERRFRHMAQHDALTGLATRPVLHHRLNVGLQLARHNRTGVAILMLDVDSFKSINDSFGHDAGDEVLRVTASRLIEALRSTDTIARMGGDEFVVLLPNLSDLHFAENVAAKVVSVLAAPVLFAGREIPVSASVGVCATLETDVDGDTLLKRADAALYRAKARGRNCFCVFAAETAQA